MLIGRVSLVRPQLLRGAAVISARSRYHYFFRIVGRRVDESPQPFANPASRRQWVQAVLLREFRVNHAADEVAAHPQHDAVHASQLPLVFQHGKEPPLEFRKPG